MSDETLCRCCGVPVEDAMIARGGVSAQHCAFCHVCGGSRMHGDELERALLANVARGSLGLYTAIAAAMVDDAHFAGCLEIHLFTEGDAPEARIVGSSRRTQRSPKRWEVVIGRALARRVMPDLQAVVTAAMLPFGRMRNLPSVRADMGREIKLALASVDPTVVDVEVEYLPTSASGELLAGDEVRLKIATTTAAPMFQISKMTEDDPDLPPDIFARPRGQA